MKTESPTAGKKSEVSLSLMIIKERAYEYLCLETSNAIEMKFRAMGEIFHTTGTGKRQRER